MNRLCLIAIILFLTVCGNSQTVINLDTIAIQHDLKSTKVKSLFSDSLNSSFCILIPNEVKAHKHLKHSEQVYVLDGEPMKSGDQTFTIKKGDLIFIPKNTTHSVKNTGKQALKVLSIQSPNFDGTDRVMVTE